MSTDDPEITPAQVITRDYMAHLGYEPEQIAAAEAQEHAAECEFQGEWWLCHDEYDNSRHPVRDEMDGVAELVMFAVEHPTLAAAATRGYRKAIERLRLQERYDELEAESEAKLTHDEIYERYAQLELLRDLLADLADTEATP